MIKAENKINLVFIAILVLYTFLALYGISTLSISYDEINKFNLANATNIFMGISFVDKDIAVKMPSLLLSLFNIILLFIIAKSYLSKGRDALYTILLFSIMNGVYISSVIVTQSVLNTAILFIFVYLFNKIPNVLKIVLMIGVFRLENFYILYIALFFYGFHYKQKDLYISSLILLIASLLYHGFPIDEIGNNFLDNIGIFPALLGVPFFVYFFYAHYRNIFIEEKDIVWYIGATALIVSFFYSLKPSIYLDDLACFLFIGILKVVKEFSYSYRVRLKVHRQKTKIILVGVLVFTMFQFLLMVFNYSLYSFLDEDSHFAKKYHFAKELSVKLKQDNISQLQADKRLMTRLEYYGISKGDKYIIKEFSENYYKKYTLIYFDKKVKTYFIEKI